MNGDSDNIYYKKNFFVVKDDNLYFCWSALNSTYFPSDSNIIKKNLNWFEAVKLVKILNKLNGKYQ